MANMKIRELFALDIKRDIEEVAVVGLHLDCRFAPVSFAMFRIISTVDGLNVRKACAQGSLAQDIFKLLGLSQPQVPHNFVSRKCPAPC